MEKKKPMKILAIKPGSKFLGIAVFKDIELIDWRIKKVKVKGMKPAQVLKKAEMITARFIEDYEPGILAMEKACFPQSRKSELLSKIVSRIVCLGNERGLRVRFFNPTEAKDFICQKKRATKMEAENKISSEYYPWLHWRYKVDSKRHWYEKTYHATLFTAVALGIYCYYRKGRGYTARKTA